MKHVTAQTGITSGLLYPGSLVYAGALRARSWLYRRGWVPTRRLPRPVISVGNLTVGGTGKTPLVAFLARHLKQKGYQPVVLTRGYRSAQERGCFLASDGQTVAASLQASGDEAYWLAHKLAGVPVLVGKDRYRCALRFLDRFGQCFFILDDGFQHLRLARNLNLLLLDATNPFGNGRVLPAGTLREPLAALSRADAIVVTRSDHAFDLDGLQQKVRQHNRTVSFHFSYHDIIALRDVATGETHQPARLSQQRVCVMSAIGNPAAFESDLRHYQIQIASHAEFPDHHGYVQLDLDRIFSEADRLGAGVVVTTEKDAVKMRSLRFPSGRLLEAIAETRMEDEKHFLEFVEGYIF